MSARRGKNKSWTIRCNLGSALLLPGEADFVRSALIEIGRWRGSATWRCSPPL